MKTAPIALFTFKRIDSLKQCIASLAACELGPASDLIVFSDAPRNEADVEKVNAVRHYLRTLDQFASVKLIEREKNLGVDFNIINGLKEMSAKHEKFIILEDDLVFAPNFLLFMNEALAKYEGYSDVLSVSGFSFVKSIPSGYGYDGYFANRSWSWGWGTWGDKMKHVDWEVSDFSAFMADRSIQAAFNHSGGSDLTKMLRETMTGKIRAWDIRLFYYQFKQKMVTLYPTHSKVTNIGFTSEGHNTFGYNRYKTALDDTGKRNFALPGSSEKNKTLNAAFLRKNNLTSRVLTRVFTMAGIK